MRSKIKNNLVNLGQKRHILLITVVISAGTISAFACGWMYITDHSVRFNSERTGRAFYRLPPLPLLYDPSTGKEVSTRAVENYSWEEDRDAVDKLAEQRDQAYDRARVAVDLGNLADVKPHLEKYLELSSLPESDEVEHGERQSRRNLAYDVLDALTAIKQGVRPVAVQAYLKARYGSLTDSEEEAEALQSNRQLEDNWAYLRAAKLYNAKSTIEALRLFQHHASAYPQSEKHEAVLYMIAKLTMEQSYSFTGERCGIMGDTRWGNEIARVVEPTEKCQDENWHNAVKAFQQVMRAYPTGRYFNDARGWVAFLYKRGGERAKALAEYYRLLGHPTDRSARLEGKKSLQIIGHEYDDATLDRVEELISDDANTALTYAYHRIYNHAADFTYEEFDEWCYSGDASWSERNEETKRVKEAHNTGRRELERIAKFATAMIKRHGLSRGSGEFVLRVAQAQLELQNFKDALRLSNQALASGVAGDGRAQALWVKGSAEHQQKKFSTSRATISQLIKEFPDHTLTEGARRLLAIIAEDQDDLETALDQYLILKYEHDVAYFIDILLPTDRLAKFVSARKDTGHYSFLLYALGIRYVRDRRWPEARETMKRVITRTVPVRDLYWNDQSPRFAKEPEYRDGQNPGIIHTSWVMRDLQTIDDLERLELIMTHAVDDEAKAEAMYQLASYQYDADALLFYNPAAWDGERHMLLYKFGAGNNMRLAGESWGIFEYSKSHETLARAIPIYLDIVDRYPNTKAAKDALYSAVIAHEKLGDLNPYWRDIYESGLFAGQRLVNNSDIRQMFPRFRWPTSRVGWEASTRTVNGGSPYPPPPKSPPTLSRGERIERKLQTWVEQFKPVIAEQASSVNGKASQLSDAVTLYLLAYLYTVFTGLVALVLWQNRRELYEGPIRKGLAIGRTLGIYLRKAASSCLSKRGKENGEVNEPGKS